MKIDPGKDYYSVLGVLPVAEDVVIKGAYRALAQRYHPDRFVGSKEEGGRLMAAINEAYFVLSDPDLREAYDKAFQQDRTGGSLPETHSSFEVEQYRPFAQRLLEWGYDEKLIQDALIARGVRLETARFIAENVMARSRTAEGS